jgi:DnaJ-class molecular chaperone
MDFHQRKAERTEHFYRFVYGWKLRDCTACNGTGHYDHNGSPPCGCCNGTGKERYRDEGVCRL